MPAAFPSSAAFDAINQALSSDDKLRKSSVKKVNALVVFKLTNADNKTEHWYLDLKQDGKVGKGTKDGADATLVLKESDFGNLVSGKANAQKLFMGGKLKVQGNPMKVMGIEGVLKAAKAKL